MAVCCRPSSTLACPSLRACPQTPATAQPDQGSSGQFQVLPRSKCHHLQNLARSTCGLTRKEPTQPHSTLARSDEGMSPSERSSWQLRLLRHARRLRERFARQRIAERMDLCPSRSPKLSLLESPHPR